MKRNLKTFPKIQECKNKDDRIGLIIKMDKWREWFEKELRLMYEQPENTRTWYELIREILGEEK